MYMYMYITKPLNAVQYSPFQWWMLSYHSVFYQPVHNVNKLSLVMLYKIVHFCDECYLTILYIQAFCIVRYLTFSMASVISPTVHRARAASMDSWSRLPWLLEQALVMASNASCACGRRNKIHLMWRFFCKCSYYNSI